MKCPQCQNELKEVKTSCNYGIPIILDQCPACGGLWFDEDELYRTKSGAAMEIEGEVNGERLAASLLPVPDEMRCPRDNVLLKDMKDPYFSSQLKVKVCPQCMGFWFNGGEFKAFQDWRASKILKTASPKEGKSDKETDEKMQKQVVALMKMYSELESKQDEEKNKDMIQTAVYLIWTLLRILIFKR